jgi:hypothetical protein
MLQNLSMTDRTGAMADAISCHLCQWQCWLRHDVDSWPHLLKLRQSLRIIYKYLKLSMHHYISTLLRVPSGDQQGWLSGFCFDCLGRTQPWDWACILHSIYIKKYYLQANLIVLSCCRSGNTVGSMLIPNKLTWTKSSLVVIASNKIFRPSVEMGLLLRSIEVRYLLLLIALAIALAPSLWIELCDRLT